MSIAPAAIPSEVELEEVGCPLCPSAPHHLLLVGRDRLMDLPGTFPVVQCRECGLARTSPRPTQSTIGYYYPADYGPYRETAVEPTSSGQGLRARALRLVKCALDTRATSIPPMPPGRMLEIGCASGSYLCKMASEGWQVEGIEFSAEAAAAARALGLPVETGAIETIDRPDASFDLIVGWMVLEHLHDPVGSLRKLARWIRPGGRLALSVPNGGAAECRIFKDRWYALQLPTHLFHFDPPSLTAVLKAGGWKVERVLHQRSLANLMASTGYWLSDIGWARLGQRLIDFPEKGGRVGALLTFPFAWALAVFGQTGRMTVWASPANE